MAIIFLTQYSPYSGSYIGSPVSHCKGARANANDCIVCDHRRHESFQVEIFEQLHGRCLGFTSDSRKHGRNGCESNNN